MQQRQTRFGRADLELLGPRNGPSTPVPETPDGCVLRRFSRIERLCQRSRGLRGSEALEVRLA
eukprot:8587666-Alexandrium_andersonii.AAC.1